MQTERLTPKPEAVDKPLAQLEQVLAGLLAENEQLLSLLKHKRVALGSADYKQVTDCCRRENEQVQAISELEKRRLSLVGELTQLVDPAAAEPLRMVELAERLGEPARGRLLVQRVQLQERMEQARRETGVVQRATESLFKHMQGLIQTIGAVCTGVGTYGQTGSPPRAALSVSTFNTTA